VSVDEWDMREVCPDGACVGVIGPDGLCKVCGRAAQNWGDERKRGLVETAVDDEELDDDETDDEVEDEDADGEDIGDDVEWGKRRLCSNGSCVGVIGDDGTCSVCGAAP